MNSPQNFDDQRAHGAILNFFLRAYGQPKRPKSIQLSIRSVGRAVVTLADIEISALEEKDIGPIADELFTLAMQKTQEVKRTERFELTADTGSPPPFIFQVHYKTTSRTSSKALPPRGGGMAAGSSGMMDGGYAPDTMAGMTGMEGGDADMPIEGEFDNGISGGGAGGYYPHEFAMPGTDAPVRHQGAAFALQAFKGFRDLHRTSLQGFKFQIASLMRQVVHQQKVIEGYERTHEDMVLARENSLSQQAERDRLRSASEREDAYRSTALVSLLSAAPELLERVTGKPLGDEQKALFHSLAQAHLTGDPKATALAAGNVTKGLLSPQVAHVAASETGTTAEGVILRAGQAAIILKGVDEWMASFTAEQLAALHMTTRQAEEHAALVAIFEKERPIFHSLAKAEEAGKVQSKITSPAESKEEAEEEAKAIKAMTTWFASIQLDQLPSFKPVMTQGQYALLESLVVPKDQAKPNPENVAVDSKVVKS